VKTRTRYKNRIHAHLANLNLVSPRTDLFGKQGRLWLSTLELPEETRFQVDLLLEMLTSSSCASDASRSESSGRFRSRPRPGS
jgi:hypothetical protein